MTAEERRLLSLESELDADQQFAAYIATLAAGDPQKT